MHVVEIAQATEKLCGAHPNITRAAQQADAVALFGGWLGFVDGAAPFGAFEAALGGLVRAGKAIVLASDWTGCE